MAPGTSAATIALAQPQTSTNASWATKKSHT